MLSTVGVVFDSAVLHIYFIEIIICVTKYGLPGGTLVRNLPANVGGIGDLGSIAGSGRSRGGGRGNPLHYSCLENHGQRSLWGYSS